MRPCFQANRRTPTVRLDYIFVRFEGVKNEIHLLKDFEIKNVTNKINKISRIGESVT